MEKRDVIVIIVIIIFILILSSILFFIPKNENQKLITELQYNTCYFDDYTWDLNCSEELRIILNKNYNIQRILYQLYNCSSEKNCILIEENFNLTNNSSLIIPEKQIECIYIDRQLITKECYYLNYTYTNISSTNLIENYNRYVNKEYRVNRDSISPTHVIRSILVKDINTDEVYEFFLNNSGVYHVNIDNSYIGDLNYCNSGKFWDFCIGNENIKCGLHGNYQVQGCKDLAMKVDKGTAPVKSCYDIVFEEGVAYCLPIEECLKFSNNQTNLIRLCKYRNCSRNEGNNCLDLYYYGDNIKDCSDLKPFSKAYCYLKYKEDIGSIKGWCKKEYFNRHVDEIGCVFSAMEVLHKLNLSYRIDIEKPCEIYINSTYDINGYSDCKGYEATFTGDYKKCIISGKFNSDCIDKFDESLNRRQNENIYSLEQRNRIWSDFCNDYFNNDTDKVQKCMDLNTSRNIIAMYPDY